MVYAITDTEKGRTGIAPTYLQTTLGRKVPHLRCDSHTGFKVKRSKVRVRGGRGNTASAEPGGHTACWQTSDTKVHMKQRIKMHCWRRKREGRITLISPL